MGDRRDAKRPRVSPRPRSRSSTSALPAILSIEDAIAAGSFLTDGERLHRGDAEGALRDAPHRLDGELHIGGQEHFYLETHAALAYRDRRGRA